MTKKKRLRKERHRQPGNPPPPNPHDQIAALAPTERAMFDAMDGERDPEVPDDRLVPDELDDLDAFGDGLIPVGHDRQLRPFERHLMRIQRYLEREGITVTPENEAEVRKQLEQHDWLDDADSWPSTPLERAQELVYDAFELPDGEWEDRINLAKAALRISHNCADAEVLLAENDAQSDESAQRHYTRAVKAAERAFKDVDVSPRDFWQLMKIRPLLRALYGLAATDTLQGDYDRALTGWRRLYEIDHLDVLEVRDGYVGLLMDQQLDEEFLRFLDVQERIERIDHESVHLQYSLVLALLRTEGATVGAQAALQIAALRNPLVLRLLLGLERPKLDALVFGTESNEARAVEYFLYDCRLWLRTPNAIEWLREHAPPGVVDETPTG